MNLTDEKERLKRQILAAFENVLYPGDNRLAVDSYGEEPELVASEFRGKDDWRLLSADFLDTAPDDWGSALCFFSDEAFRYYLPAYLIADLASQLRRQNPDFHLYCDFTDEYLGQQLPLYEFTDEGMVEIKREESRFAAFDTDQSLAVVAYLQYKARIDEFSCDRIEQSLRNFWLAKAAGESC